MRSRTERSQVEIFWCQARALTKANLKCRYRKTFAGFLWVILNPMITFGVQALVFQHFLKLQVDGYLLFLVAGLLPWIFIVQSLEMSSQVFVMSGPLMKSFSASPLVYLAAQAMDNLVNFFSSFAVALVPVVFFQLSTTTTFVGVLDAASTPSLLWRLMLLPLPALPLAIGVFGLAWLIATTQVFLRDTRFLLGFALNLGFFLTPVFYPRSFVPESMQWLIDINPLYHLILPFQVLIHDFSSITFFRSLGISFLLSMTLVALAAWNWVHRRNMVYFYV